MESTLALKYVLIFQLANVVIKTKCGVIICVCAHCLSLPLSRQTDDQQVVAFLPVAHMDQMFPQQKRGTMKERKAI